MPAVISPSGATDLATLMLRNRVVFIGSPVNSEVAQTVISQLLTLAAIDDKEDIKLYINCPGGSTYSVMAIYDAMAWIKPDVSTVCFGIAASQGALLLAGGKKGKRFAMPNARIMIHQPQGGCGGTADDVRRQVNEVMSSRDKIDKMYSAFCNQPVERVRKFTDRDHFFSAAEACEFGLIDGLLETQF
jgi:ATP-dependent Clp protease protease subunit